jgi:hypothetical protein
MPELDLDARIDELYGLAPAEFTAARNRLAQELRAAVAATMRPRRQSWAGRRSPPGR